MGYELANPQCRERETRCQGSYIVPSTPEAIVHTGFDSGRAEMCLAAYGNQRRTPGRIQAAYTTCPDHERVSLVGTLQSRSAVHRKEGRVKARPSGE